MRVKIPALKRRRPAVRWIIFIGIIFKRVEPKMTARNVVKTRAREEAKKTRSGDFWAVVKPITANCVLSPNSAKNKAKKTKMKFFQSIVPPKKVNYNGALITIHYSPSVYLLTNEVFLIFSVNQSPVW